LFIFERFGSLTRTNPPAGFQSISISESRNTAVFRKKGQKACVLKRRAKIADFSKVHIHRPIQNPKSKIQNTLMRFRFVWIGKTKDKNWRALQEDYLGRLAHFVRLEITEIRDDNAGVAGESKRILENVNQTSFVCLLDPQGRETSSHELAETIEKWQNRGLKQIAFVIGGAGGVSREVVEKADYSLSLSRLTLTHEMARVILIEQLYRAFTIIKGYPYQK
jgi:23S rRNA (pseudouridine1915-N3)-methyltransferase